MLKRGEKRKQLLKTPTFWVGISGCGQAAAQGAVVLVSDGGTYTTPLSPSPCGADVPKAKHEWSLLTPPAALE